MADDKTKKIFELLSEAKLEAFKIKKPELKEVTVEDVNRISLALKDRAMQPGHQAGSTCCCCYTCCCCAAAVVQ